MDNLHVTSRDYCTSLWGHLVLVLHTRCMGQGRSKLFEGGVAKVYIPPAGSRGVWGYTPPVKF